MPLPKVSNPTGPTDFRSISLLLVFFKILEKIVANQMTTYLKNANMLDQYQSAYKGYHSTTTALIDITDNIYKALDKSEITILVLLDYSKAFDCANHKLILAKLKAMGFKDSSLQWIESYLTDRQQQVFTNFGRSEWATMKNGVPQGSVLGPLLFTVLVADLNKVIKECKYHMYADDTQIYCSGSPNNIDDLARKINSDLDNIANYSKNNFLKLNASKSTYIIIGSRTNLKKVANINIPLITMNGKIIDRKSYVRNLGVIFDEALSWEKHVNHIVANAYGRLKQVYRHKNFLCAKSKIKICESYILSHFNYCDIILQNMSGSLKNKIQKVQNTCTRLIFDMRKYYHISNIFKTLMTLNMTNRRLFHSISLMHKIEKKMAPKYLSDKIIHFNEIHTHNTRGNRFIITTKANTSAKQNTFIYYASKKYNEFLKNIKGTNNTSVYTFKNKCKEYILKHCENGLQ